MQQSRQETLVYSALWAVAFAVPVLSLYVRTVTDDGYTLTWHDAWFVYRRLLPLLLLFVVHNRLLAPLLVYRKKPVGYALLTLAMLTCFTIYQCSHRPPSHAMPPHMERDIGGPRFMEHDFTPAPPPPPIVGEHDILAVAALILIFGLNLGIKNYFKSTEDRRRLDALERKNLEQQLEYLRYQVNPHFFMNTLNNIHALVDIDPEKAKETIVELSKMMRYILYEGNKDEVPLARELDFIRHYITLMRLRFTDKVKVTALLTPPAKASMPPLLLITFVENAFKHGVSYQNNSFVHVETSVGAGRLRFVCRNSKTSESKPAREKGGVGLANVRQRLNLIYGTDYALRIDDLADTYNVELVIPLKT